MGNGINDTYGGVGFKSIGNSVMETGKSLNGTDVFKLEGIAGKTVDEVMTDVVNTKFANFDSKSSSLAPLACIKTELSNEILQKDSPLALANTFAKGLNVIKNR